MKTSHRIALAGIMCTILLLTCYLAASAQGLVVLVTPQVDGELGENGWYVSEVSVTWQLWLLPEGYQIVQGCQDTVITEDTPPEGVTLVCQILYPGTGSHGGGLALVKKDDTPPEVVTNLPPGPPLTVDEGSLLGLDASGSFDATSGVAVIRWDSDQDGLFDDGNPAAFEAKDGIAQADTEPFLLVAQVVDQAGNVAQMAIPVFVRNVPPALDALQTTNSPFGTFELRAPFTDPGLLDTHTAMIDWGDGVVEPGMVEETDGAGDVFGTHFYDKKRPYGLTVTLTDKDGGTDQVAIRVRASAAGQVPVSLSGQFAHQPPGAAYRTSFRSANSLLFAAGESGAEALFSLEAGGCLGTLSWGAGTSGPQTIGPAVACLASGSTSPAQVNQWLRASGHGNELALRVPLALMDITQDGARLWTNPTPVTARTFVQPCGTGDFLTYGELSFAPETLLITTWTDATTGRPAAELSGSPALTATNPDTWDALLAACDDQGLLPTTAAPGASLVFSGGVPQTLLDPSTIYGGLTQLQGLVGGLSFAGRLADETTLQLNHVLDKIARALRQSQGGKVLLELDKLIVDIQRQAADGAIDALDAGTLIDQALGLRDDFATWEEIAPQQPEPEHACTGDGGECLDTYLLCVFSGGWVGYQVRAGAPAAGADGSEAQPFPTIQAALDRAAAQAACGVTLTVAPGTYTGDITTSGHTFILGQGSRDDIQIQGQVIHHGPFRLKLKDVYFHGLPSTAEAAVFSDHPCAKVELEGVGIVGVRGYGVFQQGGSLWMRNSFVWGTRAGDDYLTQGTAIYLACGVQASLYSIGLDGNESSGLQVVGPGTEVYATHLLVRNTGMHPRICEDIDILPPSSGPALGPYCAPIRGTGGVNVRDGAVLHGDRFFLWQNANAGLSVSFGGSVFLENATIRDSYQLDGAGIGANAIVAFGGYLRLANFALTHAERCGLQLVFDGAVDLRDGEVTHNYIGACLQVADYDLDRLTVGVRYAANATNIQASALPIPDPPAIPVDP